MRAIQIRYTDFRVVLNADKLNRIPQIKFRKLIKLAFRDIRNVAALQELGSILKENVLELTASQEKAELNQAKARLKIFNEMEINTNGSSNYQ